MNYITVLRRLPFLAILLSALVALCACGGGNTPAPTTSGPTISLTPDSGGFNTEVTVAGSGFPPNATVDIHMGLPSQAPDPKLYTSGVTDGSGSFSAALVIPQELVIGQAITVSQLIVSAATRDGQAQSSAPFTLDLAGAAQPQISLRPAQGAPGTTAQVVGIKFEPGATISLRLGQPNVDPNPPNLAQVTADQTGSFTTTVTIPDQWPGTSNPVVEPGLLVAAYNERRGLVVATAAFLNESRGTGTTPRP